MKTSSPTLSMMHSQKKTCEAEECALKQVRGKVYCIKHLQTHGKQKMTKETQTLLRSNCCNAPCTVGEKHEYGEQYCNKCSHTCIWKIASAEQAVAQ